MTAERLIHDIVCICVPRHKHIYIPFIFRKTLSVVLERLISLNNKWFRNKESGTLKNTQHSGLLTTVNKTQIEIRYLFRNNIKEKHNYQITSIENFWRDIELNKALHQDGLTQSSQMRCWHSLYTINIGTEDFSLNVGRYWVWHLIMGNQTMAWLMVN